MEKDYKRKWCLTWDQYFMGVAFITSQRSKDPRVQVGSCIVNQDNRIISTGYNGMPNGCDDSIMPWGKGNPDPLKNKTFFVCHSEMNAILNTRVSLTGCKIYVTLVPCSECAKAIIQSGIREVVYYTDRGNDTTKASKIMFKTAKIKIRQYENDKLLLTIGQKFTSKL